MSRSLIAIFLICKHILLQMDPDKDWPLEPFNDAVIPSDLRREWEEWFRAFELIIELRRIESQHDKLLLLLARGGRGLQRIYYHLRPTTDEIHPEPVKVPFRPTETPEYDNAVKRLNNYFVGKRNERIELEMFRSLRQSPEESFNNFILKLRTQAARCDFQVREEMEIFHQVAMGARDERVRDKGLENTMSLDELTNYAVNREMLLKQKEKVLSFKAEADPGMVAAVKQEWNRKPRPTNSGWREKRWEPNSRDGLRDGRDQTECENCGSWKHRKDSQECSARNVRCNGCGRTGHYVRKCPRGHFNREQDRGNTRNWKRTSGEANSLREDERRRYDYRYREDPGEGPSRRPSPTPKVE